MKITSAKFLRGIVREDELLERNIPQVAFIGRSNVGKSSVINSLTNQKGLARTSSFPGRTTEINLFLINGPFYLLDLPGYGFAKASIESREKILNLIRWYLFGSHYYQRRVVLIIDAEVGPTENDFEMVRLLEDGKKEIVVVANKIDKVKKSHLKNQLGRIENLFRGHRVIPYSSKNKIGVKELTNQILG